MIGNGITNYTHDKMFMSGGFPYFRSLIDTATHDRINKLGCDYSGIAYGEYPTGECYTMLQKIGNTIKDVNLMNIYEPCWTKINSDKQSQYGLASIGGELKSYKKYITAADYVPWLKHASHKLGMFDIHCAWGQ